MKQPEIGTLATVEPDIVQIGHVVESSPPPQQLAISPPPRVLNLNIKINGKAAHTSMRDEVNRGESWKSVLSQPLKRHDNSQMAC